MSEEIIGTSDCRTLEEKLRQADDEINRLRVSLRAEQLRVKISSEYSNFGLWEYDIAEDICYQYKKLNGRYESILDPIVRFRDTVISWGTVYVEDLPAFNSFCDAMERGDKEVGCDVRVINDSFDLVWFRYEGKTVCDDSGKPVKVVGRTLDVTEEKGGTDVRSDPRRDPLTGLMTLDAFKDEVAKKRRGTNSYVDFGLFVIHIDGFEESSKKYGSEYAEAAQKAAAKVLSNISACEHDSLAARVCPGEFVMFFRYKDTPSLNTIAARVVFSVGGIPFSAGRITISLGISILKSRKPCDVSVNEAHIAMEQATARGGNGYLQYAGEMSIRAMYSNAAENEPESVTVVAGASEIYENIYKALIRRELSAPLLAKAFRAAGKFIGVTSIFLYSYENGRYDEYRIYSPDAHSGKVPCVVREFEGDTLEKPLAEGNKLWLDFSVRQGRANGFSLANGAESAEIRFIMRNDRIMAYFAIVSDSRMTLQESDGLILQLFQDTLTELYAKHLDDEQERRRNHFVEVVAANHHIEGFTLIPGTYTVDYVSPSAVARYDMKAGDTCYEKIVGYDAPCHYCPISKLEKCGMLSASSAAYREKEHRWVNIIASTEFSVTGDKRYAVSSVDINDCLGEIKSLDTLTGVMTLDAFSAEAMRLIADKKPEYYVAAINIAGFRSINESKGYEYGNSVLIAVSDVLANSLGAGELICRSEGSRFVVMFKNKSDTELTTRMNQLFASVQKQVYERCETQIYLIVGVFDMRSDNIGIMGALDRALTAQKTIRNKTYYHENLIAMYDETLRTKLKERRYIEDHMLDALDNGEFKVYYQPKVSISTGRIDGAEALVRWIKADGEIISPGSFIPIFEENGFIADMDFAIYRQSVADIKRWLRNGIDVPLISLNVSRHHLKDDSFADKINALVDSLGVPHEKIELEITESLLTENLGKLIDIMTSLKEKGFRISVDDFGSGYSSLNLITQLPFDTLKIDGGFFLKNELTEKNRKVISSVITLAKSLSLKTVSEGVETGEQVSFLKGLGCDMVQGYYYYKPMPSKDFERLIAEQS